MNASSEPPLLVARLRRQGEGRERSHIFNQKTRLSTGFLLCLTFIKVYMSESLAALATRNLTTVLAGI